MVGDVLGVGVEDLVGGVETVLVSLAIGDVLGSSVTI